LLHRYLDLVLYSAIVDPEIAQAYFNVLTLATPPRSLVRPLMVAHVMAVASKRAVRRLLGGKDDSIFALSPEALSSLHARHDIRNKPISFLERKK
jgi:hypothetical protein